MTTETPDEVPPDQGHFLIHKEPEAEHKCAKHL